MKERVNRLRQLRKDSAGMQEFVKKAAEDGLTVSMGEGRRLWFQLESKEDTCQNSEQQENTRTAN